MTMQELVDYLDFKVENSENFVRITFYEIRVKFNLTEEETRFVLEISKNKFENMGYKTYFAGDEYIYNNIKYTVGSNDLMIAIKE